MHAPDPPVTTRAVASTPIEPPADGVAAARLPSWRWEAMRTTLWIVPTLLVAVSVVLFVVTQLIDHVLAAHHARLPGWLNTGDADAGREVLIATAAAVITVVGVVFSITILALTLASQQFGPRMMRNFVRDLGSQITLGVFVGTFVYSVLALGSITSSSSGSFVPHLTITVAEALLLVDLGVLIYFIHHIAKTIQLPEVIASIARDLLGAIDSEYPRRVGDVAPAVVDAGRSLEELQTLLEERGGVVRATHSGYLQYVGYSQLVKIASHLDAVIQLTYRPGHYLIAGRPMAKVWPGGAAAQVAEALHRAHVTGPHRTLQQDPVFAIDQLSEIAIRALSPAVNDTFTALTCIDWLSAGLSEVSRRQLTEAVYRDGAGRIRLISSSSSYERMVNRAIDKIRQASGGMPAVLIRLLDALNAVGDATTNEAQRAALRREGDMVLDLAVRTIQEPQDLHDVQWRHERLVATLAPASAST